MCLHSCTIHISLGYIYICSTKMPSEFVQESFRHEKHSSQSPEFIAFINIFSLIIPKIHQKSRWFVTNVLLKPIWEYLCRNSHQFWCILVIIGLKKLINATHSAGSTHHINLKKVMVRSQQCLIIPSSFSASLHLSSKRVKS